MNINLELSYTPAQLDIFFNNPVGTKYIIATKGRRFGATKGAANACIEWALEGLKVLWGDTINSNIDRYFQRYIEPELKSNKIEYNWSAQKKELRILEGWIDFRSADRPENWEGFGYDKIFLNEAGIILKNDYLYTNAVLPMLLDSPGSELYALGVPKGKFKRNGQKHRFYDLFEQGLHKTKGFRVLEFSSYDNPLLKDQDIKELETEIGRMNPQMIDQEIYGKFVEGAFNALFDLDTIVLNRVEVAPSLSRIIVAVDPAISNSSTSDETGIVVLGMDARKHVYVLEDVSGRHSPRDWAAKVKLVYDKWRANAVIAEVNQGGDMVEETIKIHDRQIRVVKINASRGKYVRAEPVAAFYDEGKIHHVGSFPTLETQMISWQGLNGEKSPDRIDALVHGCTYLIGKSSQKITKFSGARGVKIY